jgi:G3E family GTPase
MLNHLLTKSALHRKGRKLAVLVNEFGQVAIALAALCCWM